MKLFFNLFILLYTSNILARNIILVEYSEELKLSFLQQEIKSMGIPDKLITYKKVSKCLKDTESILHLCLSKGTIKVIHENKSVLEKSFGIYGYGKED